MEYKVQRDCNVPLEANNVFYAHETSFKTDEVVLKANPVSSFEKYRGICDSSFGTNVLGSPSVLKINCFTLLTVEDPDTSKIKHTQQIFFLTKIALYLYSILIAYISIYKIMGTSE